MRWLTTREVAERTGRSVRAVRRAIGDGRLAAHPEPGTGRWLIGVEEAAAFAARPRGRPGRKPGVLTSPIRTAIRARLRRVGAVRARELARELEVTVVTVRGYLRELGARYDADAGVWRAEENEQN